jgi:hypothetical protein
MLSAVFNGLADGDFFGKSALTALDATRRELKNSMKQQTGLRRVFLANLHIASNGMWRFGGNFSKKFPKKIGPRPECTHSPVI